MRWMSLCLVVLAACSAGETKVAHEGDEGVDPAKAQLLINEARNQIESESYDKARDLLAQAVRVSDAKTRHTADRVGEEVDDAESATVTKAVTASVAAGKCEQAIDETAQAVTSRANTGVPALVKQRTGEQHLACVNKLLAGGELTRARKLRDSDNAKVALDGSTAEQLNSAVGDAVLTSLRKAIAEPMKAREWKKVAAILQSAVDKGEAGEADRVAVLKDVRPGIIEDVDKTVRDAFGNKDAEPALARVDEDIAAGYWKPRPEAVGPVDAEQALVQKALGNDDDEASSKGGGPTEVVPEKLHRLRVELAFWVGCDKTRCKETPPAKMWTYGKLPLGKIQDPESASKRVLSHGRVVWKLAEGGSNALVSTKAPGKLADLASRAHVGVGWVKSASLKPLDTSEWLPPGKSIVGTRVWGPLRDGAKEYELGKALGVDGAKVQVQRLSDHAVVTVPLAQLHFGITKKGIEVLAMCGGMKLQTARIESVVEPKHESLGDARAKLNCIDAQGNVTKTYEDPLGALRIKRTSLPPRR